MGAEFTLAPERANLKVNAVAFIQHCYDTRGAGCSLRELAAALGMPEEIRKVRRLVRQLERDGRILRFAGMPRGLLPVSAQQRALELLRQAGYTIDPEGQCLFAPPVTDLPLPVPIELLHIPDIEIDRGDSHERDGAD